MNAKQCAAGICVIVVITVAYFYLISTHINDNNIKIKDTDEKGYEIMSHYSANDDEIVTAALSDLDFIIKNANTNIVLGEKNSDIITNEKVLEIVYANETHIYDVVKYKSFVLITEPLQDLEGSIYSISIKSPVLQTSRDIHIGDPISKVIKNYGKAKSILLETNGYTYKYFYKDKILNFHSDKNQVVTGIELEFL